MLVNATLTNGRLMMSLYNEPEYTEIEYGLLEQINVLRDRIYELEVQTDRLYEQNAMLIYAIEELKE